MWAAVNQDGDADADRRDEETTEDIEIRLVAMYQRSLQLQHHGSAAALQQARVILLELLADVGGACGVKGEVLARISSQQMRAKRVPVANVYSVHTCGTLRLRRLSYLALVNLASLHERAAEHERALRCLTSATSIDGTDVLIWYKLGRLAESCDKIAAGNSPADAPDVERTLRPHLRLARHAYEMGLLAAYNISRKLSRTASDNYGPVGTASPASLIADAIAAPVLVASDATKRPVVAPSTVPPGSDLYSANWPCLTRLIKVLEALSDDAAWLSALTAALQQDPCWAAGWASRARLLRRLDGIVPDTSPDAVAWCEHRATKLGLVEHSKLTPSASTTKAPDATETTPPTMLRCTCPSLTLSWSSLDHGSAWLRLGQSLVNFISEQPRSELVTLLSTHLHIAIDKEPGAPNFSVSDANSLGTHGTGTSATQATNVPKAKVVERPTANKNSVRLHYEATQSETVEQESEKHEINEVQDDEQVEGAQPHSRAQPQVQTNIRLGKAEREHDKDTARTGKEVPQQESQKRRSKRARIKRDMPADSVSVIPSTAGRIRARNEKRKEARKEVACRQQRSCAELAKLFDSNANNSLVANSELLVPHNHRDHGLQTPISQTNGSDSCGGELFAYSSEKVERDEERCVAQFVLCCNKAKAPLMQIFHYFLDRCARSAYLFGCAHAFTVCQSGSLSQIYSQIIVRMHHFLTMIGPEPETDTNIYLHTFALRHSSRMQLAPATCLLVAEANVSACEAKMLSCDNIERLSAIRSCQCIVKSVASVLGTKVWGHVIDNKDEAHVSESNVDCAWCSDAVANSVSEARNNCFLAARFWWLNARVEALCSWNQRLQGTTRDHGANFTENSLQNCASHLRLLGKHDQLVLLHTRVMPDVDATSLYDKAAFDSWCIMSLETVQVKVAEARSEEVVANARHEFIQPGANLCLVWDMLSAQFLVICPCGDEITYTIEHGDLLRHDWINSTLPAPEAATESGASIIAMIMYSGHAKLQDCKTFDDAVTIGCALVVLLDYAIQKVYDSPRARQHSCSALLQLLLETLSHPAFAMLHSNHPECAFAESPRFQHIWVQVRTTLRCVLEKVLSVPFSLSDVVAQNDPAPVFAEVVELQRTYLQRMLEITHFASDRLMSLKIFETFLSCIAGLLNNHNAWPELLNLLKFLLEELRAFFCGEKEDLTLESRFMRSTGEFNVPFGCPVFSVLSCGSNDTQTTKTVLVSMRSALWQILRWIGPARRLLADRCELCARCEEHNNNKNTVLCDGCDAEFHIFCLDPPLTCVPKGDWFCPSCRIDCDVPTSAAGTKRKVRYLLALLLLRVSCELEHTLHKSSVAVERLRQIIASICDFMGSDAILKLHEDIISSDTRRQHFAVNECVVMKKQKGKAFPCVVTKSQHDATVKVKFYDTDKPEKDVNVCELRRLQHDTELLRLCTVCLADKRIDQTENVAMQFASVLSMLYGESLGLIDTPNEALERISIPSLSRPTSRAAAALLYQFWEQHKNQQGSDGSMNLPWGSAISWFVLRGFSSCVAEQPIRRLLRKLLQSESMHEYGANAHLWRDESQQAMHCLAPSCPGEVVAGHSICAEFDSTQCDPSNELPNAIENGICRNLFFGLATAMLNKHFMPALSLDTPLILSEPDLMDSSMLGLVADSPRVTSQAAELYVSELCFRDIVYSPNRAQSWHRLGLAQLRLLNSTLDRTMCTHTAFFSHADHFSWGTDECARSVQAVSSNPVNIMHARAAELIEADRTLLKLASCLGLQVDDMADDGYAWSSVDVEKSSACSNFQSRSRTDADQLAMTVKIRRRCVSCLEIAARLWRFQMRSKEPQVDMNCNDPSVSHLVQCLEQLSGIAYVEATQDCTCAETRCTSVNLLRRSMQHLEYAMQFSTMDGKLQLLLGKVLSKLIRLEPHAGGVASWKRVLQNYAAVCETFCGGEDGAAADGDTPSPKRMERHVMEALCRLHRLRLQLILGRTDDSSWLRDASALHLAEQYTYLKADSDDCECLGEEEQSLGRDGGDAVCENVLAYSVDLPSAHAPLGLKLIESDGGVTGVFVLDLEQPYTVSSGVCRGDRIIAMNTKTVASLHDIFCIMTNVRSEKLHAAEPISVTMRVARRPESFSSTDVNDCASTSALVSAASSCAVGTTVRERAVEKVAQLVGHSCAPAIAAGNACKVAASAALAAFRASVVAAIFVLSTPGTGTDDDQHCMRRFEAAIDALTALRFCQRAEKYDHRAAAAISQSLLLLSERKLVPPQVQTAIELIQQLRGCAHAGYDWACNYDCSKRVCSMVNHWLLQLSYFRSDVNLQRQPQTLAICLLTAAQSRVVKRTWRCAKRFLTVAPRGCSALSALYEAIPFSPAPDLIDAAVPMPADVPQSFATESRPVHTAAADSTSSNANEGTECVGERRSKRKRITANLSRPAVVAPARTTKPSHLAQHVAVALFNVHRGGRKLELTAVWRPDALDPMSERFVPFNADTHVRQYNVLRERYVRLALRLQYAVDASNLRSGARSGPLDLLKDFVHRQAEREGGEVLKWQAKQTGSSASASVPRGDADQTDCLHGALTCAHLTHFIFRYRCARALRLLITYSESEAVCVTSPNTRTKLLEIMEICFEMYLECCSQLTGRIFGNTTGSLLGTNTPTLDVPKRVLEFGLRLVYHKLWALMRPDEQPPFPQLTAALDACYKQWPNKRGKEILNKRRLRKPRTGK